MKVVRFPKRDQWAELLSRPSFDTEQLTSTVAEILATVRTGGDTALRSYAEQFDGSAPNDLVVSDEEFSRAAASVSQKLKSALEIAKNNIETFHSRAEISEEIIETMPGVFCWKKSLPIERVGLYVPAGTAPLFSTVLMLAIPARLAGCKEIVMCTPPGRNGLIDPATLYAAKLCGVTRVVKVGGAQAIAALTFGTESVPNVYKIFGPGNRYVTEAKLQATRYGVAIDMPAGPSELAVIADDSCIPAFVAADLLSQAEHGPDSQVILVSTSEEVLEATVAEVERQAATLPRRETALAALANSKAILVETLQDGMVLLNEYAPEHLIIATENAEELADTVTNAGSVFIGNYSCESAGDYASGTNHTLPTNAAAKAFSGVSTASFTKTITFQRLTRDGLDRLGPTIETMAAAEGLDAHKNAVKIRREVRATQ
jgi:histidinol dehydrogenase